MRENPQGYQYVREEAEVRAGHRNYLLLPSLRLCGVSYGLFWESRH